MQNLLNFKDLSIQAFVVSFICYSSKEKKLILGIMSTQGNVIVA